jgi:hypothetical protein
MYTYSVIIFLGSWFIFSILNQFDNKLIDFIKRFDFFHLIPSWKFFAPKPLIRSYQLYFRDKTSKEETCEWTQIPTTSVRKFRHVIWNPERRFHKLFLDAVKRLEMKIEKLEKTPEAIQISTPYLVLLNLIIHAKHLPDAQYTQFMILTNQTTDESIDDALVMCSWFHEINN